MRFFSYRLTHSRNRGFSIIELLIAIIIIGILVSILIPVIANRAEDARMARAAQEVESLADAEDRLATDVGYFGRLWLLNDVVGGDGIPFQRPVNNRDIIDGLRDHGLSGEYYNNGNYLFVNSSTGKLVNGSVGDGLLLSIQQNETNFGWRGPYMNWQRDNNLVYNGEVGPDGIPDDPWGHNYLLFTRQGMMREGYLTGAGAIVYEVEFPFPEDNTAGVNVQVYTCLRFDRATILSLGPNGLPGDGSGTGNQNGGQFGQGDDIVRKFGP